MHAFLIIGENESSESAALDLIKKNNFKRFDYQIEKIKDVAGLIKETNIKITRPTAYVISNFDNASAEAQNALLKRIEEAQENLNFILTCEVESKILPTIISRCKVIYLPREKKESEDAGFLRLTVGEKLAYIEKIKTREEAKSLMNNILENRHGLSEKVLEAASDSLNRIERNANAQLQLTNFVVAIS